MLKNKSTIIDHKNLFYYFNNKQSKIKPIIIIYLSTKNNHN